MLDRRLELSRNSTNVTTELLAGLTTFMTMAYIIFVHTAILADAGMDKGAMFVAPCLVAGLGSILAKSFGCSARVELAPMAVSKLSIMSIVRGAPVRTVALRSAVRSSSERTRDYPEYVGWRGEARAMATGAEHTVG